MTPLPSSLPYRKRWIGGGLHTTKHEEYDECVLIAASSLAAMKRTRKNTIKQKTVYTRNSVVPTQLPAQQTLRAIQSLYYQNMLVSQVKNQSGHFAMLQTSTKNPQARSYQQRDAAMIVPRHQSIGTPHPTSTANVIAMNHYNHFRTEYTTGTMARMNNVARSEHNEIPSSSQSLAAASMRTYFGRQATQPMLSSQGPNHSSVITVSETSAADDVARLDVVSRLANGKELQLRDLLTQQDRTLTTRFTVAVIEHLDFVYFEEGDRRSHRTHLPVGFRGISCRYCQAPAGKSGRFFPSSLKTLSDTQKTLYTLHKHLIKCRSTPEDVKFRLDFLKQTHLKERKTLQCHGSQRAFFRRIWSFLCPNDNTCQKFANSNVGGGDEEGQQ